MRSKCEDNIRYRTEQLVLFSAVFLLGLRKSHSGAEGNEVFRVNGIDSCSLLHNRFIACHEQYILGRAGSIVTIPR